VPIRLLYLIIIRVSGWLGENGDTDDKSRIVYNSHITLAEIPRPYRHQNQQQFAIEWIMDRLPGQDRQQTGIINDPNDRVSEHDDPRHVLRPAQAYRDRQHRSDGARG
jgi:hypothetical protein